MAYHVNNTYAKLAPDSILNKKIKEIMRYTGGHRTFPFTDSFSTVAVGQWVRRQSSDRRVVQAEGSSPGGDTYQTVFSNDFYFSFVRPNRLQ